MGRARSWAIHPPVVARLVLASALFPVLPPLAGEAWAAAAVRPELHERAHREGTVRVIVALAPSASATAEGRLRASAAHLQRARIAAAQAGVLARLAGRAHRLRRQFRTVPYLALEVDAATLAALAADPDVQQVLGDPLLRPVLAQSIPVIQADVAWDVGYDGAGQVVAIVDSGVDKEHPFLAGKVVAEACFASERGCPDGRDSQIGEGAGEPCPFDPATCLHGTHVAGIAAGSGASFSGVARGAGLISIQVFHASTTECIPFLEPVPCARAFSSDVGAALEYVYETRAEHAVAAVNLSLGGGSFSSSCDGFEPQLTAQIENLRSAGIATVVASGNSGDAGALAFPACISSAVSVGSTTKTDEVSWFSNVSPNLSLFAPGSSIVSSVPGGFEELEGTSMAAPHVTGAWAILRQAQPEATVGALLARLRQTGRPVVDERYGTGTTVPRIQIAAALGVELPVPVLTSVSPATVNAWGPTFMLTVTGADFARPSVVRVNGTAVPTTYVSKTRLTAAVPAADLATAAAALTITVFTPEPGGGTSSAASVALRQPQLSVSATRVPAGEPLTVTLTDGAGGTRDWLAVAVVGAPDTAYLQWTYVGEGLSTRAWSVTVSTPGPYEFRLFHAGGFTRMATSPLVTIDPGPTPTLSVNATTVAAGGQVTVTVTNAPGGSTDWLALATAGSPNTSYLQWTYVGAGITTRTWTVTVASPGTYEFRLYLKNTFTRAATSPVVTVQVAALLTVSATSVPAGTPVTVTLTHAPGGSADWLALAAAGAPEGSYLQWTYVGAGVTSRAWTVTLPAPGLYEFRLFVATGRAATSPVITATAAAPSLSVNATTVFSGAPVTVTLANAPGGAQDWLALASLGSTDGSYLQWTWVGGGVAARSWTATIAAPGTYEFRLFLANGTRAATSPAVTVQSTASLEVDASTVPVGAPVTVTLTGGLGGTRDWLALAAAGAANTSYLKWTYVGAGVTTRTWTVTPPAAGTYELRLFLNDGYTRAATSPPVTVGP